MAQNDITARKAARVQALVKQGVPEAEARDQANWEFRIEEAALEKEQAQASPVAEVARSIGGGAVQVARGIPGGEALAAALRYGAMRGPFAKPGDKETFAESRQAIIEAGQRYQQENPRASTALSTLGALLTLKAPGIGAATTPAVTATRAERAAQAAKFGAGYAGAQRALDIRPEEGETVGQKLASRAIGTAGQATFGAGLAAVAPWLLTSTNPLAIGTRVVGGGLAGGALAPEGYSVPGAVAGGAAMVNPAAAAGIASRAIGRQAGTAERVLGPRAGAALRAIGEFGQTTGARGAVGREASAIQELTGPTGGIVGAPAPVFGERIAQQQAFKQKADDLYNIARQDAKIVDTPAVQRLLDDPDVSAAIELAKDIRRAYGGRVPTVTELKTAFGPQRATGMAAVETAQSPAPTVREAIDAFRTRLGQSVTRKEGTVAQQTAREALERQSAMREGLPITGERTVLPTGLEPPTTFAVTREVPDPEILHLAKRIMRDITKKATGKTAVLPLQEGLRVQPKLIELTRELHTASPAYASADRFTRLGSVEAEGFQRGWSAAEPNAARPAAKKVTERGAEAAEAWVGRQGVPRTGPIDVEVQQAAAQGVARGTRGQMGAQLAARGIGEGVGGVLRAPILAESGPAVQQRQLALGAAAPAYEKTLARIRGEAGAGAVPAEQRSNIQRVLRSISNVMENEPLQAQLRSDILQNPQAYQKTLEEYRRGLMRSGMLRNVFGATGAVAPGRAARRMFSSDINQGLLPGEDPLP